MRRIFLAALLGLPLTAAADLYRWVDPATGSVKYSSYPPPWYGDEALQRRAPKVERIPAGREAPPAREEPDEPAKPRTPPVPAAGGEAKASPAAAPAAGPPANRTEAMEEQWRDMLAGFATLKRSEDVERSQGSLPPQLAAFRKLVAELDKLDPGGADRRAAESKAVVSKVEEMLRALPPRTGGLLRPDR